MNITMCKMRGLCWVNFESNVKNTVLVVSNNENCDFNKMTWYA